MTTSSFRWLHLSDLHLGMGGQRTLWPTFKYTLFDDLARMAKITGGWDLVIFSGDLVQSGKAEEFSALDETLEELWSKFDELGLNPSLLAIPGNHDVARPDPDSAEVIVLEQWFDQPRVSSQFFLSRGTQYRRCVDSAFEPYKQWIERLTTKGTIPIVPSTRGELVGDQLAQIPTTSGTVGIIALNSTWLQLSSSDAKGKLHVAVDQVLALAPDPEGWCRSNELNLIVTHQPPDWLHPKSLESWNAEIAPSGRFDAHLFGHLHEALATSVAIGAAETKHYLQAPSIFGLETVDGAVKRMHGYSIGQFIREDSHRFLRIWPRISSPLPDGKRQFVAHSRNFQLGDDDSYTLDLTNKAPAPKTYAGVARLTPGASVSTGDDVLARSHLQLPAAPSHMSIRVMEQTGCVEALKSKRCTWLVAEWGLGSDEFLWTVVQGLGGLSDTAMFRIELGSYDTRTGLLDSITTAVGCSFEELCEHLAGPSSSMLILDDVVSGEDSENVVLEIVSILLEYCPQLYVVLRTHTSPRSDLYAVHVLHTLDEADIRAYVEAHAQRDRRLLTPDTIGLLHRLTNGVPSLVDESLKELEVGSVADLISGNLDFTRSSSSPQEVSELMLRALRDVATSGDPTIQRAYELLKALAAFPQGTDLALVRHFNIQPFFPKHAVALRQRGLVVVTEEAEIDVSGAGESVKILTVPRQVRDYLRDTLPHEELQRLNRRAAELFFGVDWHTGSGRWPSGKDYSSSSCSTITITNASAVLVRLFRIASLEGTDNEMNALLELASAFVRSLSSGDHYHSLTSFCGDLLPLVPEHLESVRLPTILRRYGNALRMIGNNELATSILAPLVESDISKTDMQAALVDLAFIHSEDDDPKAIEFAQDAIALDRRSNLGLQAQGIILERSTDDETRKQGLIALERTARRRGATIVANNIAITRATGMSSLEDQYKILHDVFVNSTRKNRADHYNAIRAIVLAARNKRRRGVRLDDLDVAKLITCYQFLFHARITHLFNLCHTELFLEFRERDDVANLLTLFRYSSLRWRLQADDVRERRTAAELDIVLSSKSPDVRDPATAYYLGRRGALRISRSPAASEEHAALSTNSQDA